jgi:hypothetical protein
MVRSWVSKGSSDISLLKSFGFNSGWLVVISVQILSTLNLNRMSCKACLSAGRVSINDTDDTDDREGTTARVGDIVAELGIGWPVI